MYAPVKKYLEAAGYTVDAEVNGADVAGHKADELLIMELKKQFNVKLLFQALERQKVTDAVYVVIPRPKRRESKQFKHIKHIAESLGLGLMTVAMDDAVKTVEVVAEPDAGKVSPAGRAGERKKRAMLREISERSADVNTGGSRGTVRLTAYREKCIKIACALYDGGPSSAKNLIANRGCDLNSRDLMYKNHYGWFRRERPGVYALTAEGAAAVEDGGRFAEIVERYRAGR